MIAVFSTSSPLASVAIFSDNGSPLIAAEEWAPMSASKVVLTLLDRILTEGGWNPSDLTGFVADLGPGSFTGVKVGVTLAKALAFAGNGRCGGIPAQRLVSHTGTVVLPSRKGEVFVLNGDEFFLSENVPVGAVGYGSGVVDPVYPVSARCEQVWNEIAWTDPMHLIPRYLIEPSISTPKKPFSTAGGLG